MAVKPATTSVDARRPGIFASLTSDGLFLVAAFLSFAPIVAVLAVFTAQPGESPIPVLAGGVVIGAVALTLAIRKYKRTVRICRPAELSRGRVRNFGLQYRVYVNISNSYTANQSHFEGRTSVTASQA